MLFIVQIFEKVSIQRCEGGCIESKDDFGRLGSKALYAFIYPNFMINRYLIDNYSCLFVV